MATRGLRSGAVSDNPVPSTVPRVPGNPRLVFTSHLSPNVIPPPPAFTLRLQPVPSISLAALRQGSWLGLAAPPFARPSVHLAAPLRPMTGSITRTIERLRSGSHKGKRLARNPEVVPTNIENVPRPPHVVPKARPGFPSRSPADGRAGDSDACASTLRRRAGALGARRARRRAATCLQRLTGRSAEGSGVVGEDPATHRRARSAPSR